MIISTTTLTDNTTTTIEAARTTHTGTKIIDYLIVTNYEASTAITITIDFGHGSRTLIKDLNIPAGVAVKVIDTPMEIKDEYTIRATLGHVDYDAMVHLAIKYPPINTIKI